MPNSLSSILKPKNGVKVLLREETEMYKIIQN